MRVIYYNTHSIFVKVFCNLIIQAIAVAVKLYLVSSFFFLTTSWFSKNYFSLFCFVAFTHQVPSVLQNASAKFFEPGHRGISFILNIILYATPLNMNSTPPVADLNPILTVLSPSDIICSWLSPPNYEGGERLSFQEIILLLTFIGSCIYATVSLTIKVLAFLLQNKKSRWLGLKSAAKRKHSHKAAIIMKIALRFRKAIFGAPSGTRTQDPLIKSQLLYQLS